MGVVYKIKMLVFTIQNGPNRTPVIFSRLQIPIRICDFGGGVRPDRTKKQLIFIKEHHPAGHAPIRRKILFTTASDIESESSVLGDLMLRSYTQALGIQSVIL